MLCPKGSILRANTGNGQRWCICVGDDQYSFERVYIPVLLINDSDEEDSIRLEDDQVAAMGVEGSWFIQPLIRSFDKHMMGDLPVTSGTAAQMASIETILRNILGL